MVDLETTGITAGCCILSIGASSFDQQYVFYQKMSWQSCYDIGLVDLQSTLDWWDKQNKVVRDEAFSGTRDITDTLNNFSKWVSHVEAETKKTVYIWGNGADFDNAVLAKAYELARIEQPWGPFNGRCYRTLKNLPGNVNIKADEFVGKKHHAKWDAVNQAKHALKILRGCNNETTSKG